MWRLFGKKAFTVAKTRFAKPHVENLEDRVTPAQFDWTGAGTTALVSNADN